MIAGRPLAVCVLAVVVSAGCVSESADDLPQGQGAAAPLPLPFLAPTGTQASYSPLANGTWRLDSPLTVDLATGLRIEGELAEPGWVLYSFPLAQTQQEWEGRMNYTIAATAGGDDGEDHFVIVFFPIPVTQGDDPFAAQVPVVLTGPADALHREANRATGASSTSAFDHFFMFLAADVPVAFSLTLGDGGAVLPPQAFGVGTAILDERSAEAAPLPLRAGTLRIDSAAERPGMQLVGIATPFQPLGPTGLESGEWRFQASFSSGIARAHEPGTSSRPPTLFGVSAAPAGPFGGELTGSKAGERFGLFTAHVPFDMGLVAPEYRPGERAFLGANQVEDEIAPS